jgi:hypothetical protein
MAGEYTILIIVRPSSAIFSVQIKTGPRIQPPSTRFTTRPAGNASVTPDFHPDASPVLPDCNE